jgi:hypothetical protein
MTDTLVPQTKSNLAAILVLVVAVAMLIGAISVFTKAYNAVAAEAETKALKPSTPPTADQESSASFSFGDAVSRAASMPWFWWCLLNALFLLALGIFLIFRQPTSTVHTDLIEEDRQWSKLSYFAMFSLVGFFTVVALAIPFTWINSNEVLSRTGWATKENYTPWLIVLAYVLGLGSMFASLLAIKSEERKSAGLRRWIYGYNAFLGALLFLAILGVINAWFSLYGPDASDWTSTNIYSLSPATKRLVTSLEKPVTAYVLLEYDSPLEKDVLNTLNTCKKLSNNLDVKHIAMVMQNNRAIAELAKKYEVLNASGPGVLLVQDPDSASPLITHLKMEDLEDSMGPRGGSQRNYKGEAAIYSALRDFRQEKKKPTVYITQDSGEYTIDEAAARAVRNPQMARSMIMVKRRLETVGYIVKPLNLEVQELSSKEGPQVPDDALAVIVVDPLRMTPEKVKVLDNYLKRPKKDGVEPGKLICCFDPHFGGDGKITPTGMEGLLTDYGVLIGQDVVYALSQNLARDPTQVIVKPAQIPGVDMELYAAMANLIEQASFAVTFKECRSLKPVPQNLNFDAQTFLFAESRLVLSGGPSQRMAIWTESTRQANPAEYIQGLQKAGELLKRDFSPAGIPVAVSVRTKLPPPPQMDPRMPPPPAKPGEPRILVFGDATFLNDVEIQQSGELGQSIMASTVAWIRGKPELDSGDVKPKERRVYNLTMSGDTLSRIIWWTPAFILLAIIGIGVAVGILRRK